MKKVLAAIPMLYSIFVLLLSNNLLASKNDKVELKEANEQVSQNSEVKKITQKTNPEIVSKLHPGVAPYAIPSLLLVKLLAPGSVPDRLLMPLRAFYSADFVTAAFHWAEDSYFTENTPVIGQSIIKPNRIHHENQRKVLEYNWNETIRESVIASALLAAVATKGANSENLPFIYSVCAMGAFANQIHKCTHMPLAERPAIVKQLQDWGIFQNKVQHQKHHQGTDGDFCIMSPSLNPILEKIHFWRGLEGLVHFMTGYEARLHEEEAKMTKSKL